jgi:hypothetical protein
MFQGVPLALPGWQEEFDSSGIVDFSASSMGGLHGFPSPGSPAERDRHPLPPEEGKSWELDFRPLPPGEGVPI